MESTALNLKLEKTYDIKSYEANVKGKVRPNVIFHHLEDVAYESAENLGFGYSQLYPKGFAWFVLKYHLKFDTLPKAWETISLTTWPSENKGILCRREFEIRNNNQEKIATATSLWALINFESKRIVNAKKTVEFPMLPEEYALNSEFNKIETFDSYEIEKNISINFDNIDLNGHVNNSIYISWASNSLPYEFLIENSISEIQIEFKNEAKFGEEIVSLAHIDNESNITYHKLTSKETGLEVAFLKINWAKDEN